MHPVNFPRGLFVVTLGVLVAACGHSEGNSAATDKAALGGPGSCSPSPNRAVVTAPGPSLCDAAGNTWSLVASQGSLGNQIAKNGSVDPITQQVTELAYVNGTLWQKAYDTWWAYSGGGWTPPNGTPTSPLDGALCSESPDRAVVMGPGSGLCDSAGVVWTLVASASLGNQIARDGVVDLVTQQVTELAYVNGTVWQKAYNLWWAYSGGSWTPPSGTTTSPLDGAPPPPPPPPPSPPPSPGATTLLGIVPSDQPNNLQDVQAFGAWLGKPVQLILDYVDLSSWANFDGDAAWEAGFYGGTTAQLVWSVPLTTPGTSLAQVASGSNDASFLNAARIFADKTPGAIIRIGWEFNGNWYPWGIGVGGSAQDYIDAFRHVVALFRSVSPKFTYDWCTNWSLSSSPPDQAYPGDDVVDIIGMDTYDQTGNAANDWSSNVVGTSFGLAWHATFAAQHGKRMSYPEWAAGQHGDDPAFIQNMYDWITSHDVAYHAYWNVLGGGYDGILSTGLFPNEAATYKATFGR
jgi:Glycosyl hydrolase family 26